MRVIEPHQLGQNRAKTRKVKPLRILSIAVVVTIVLWSSLAVLYFYNSQLNLSPTVEAAYISESAPQKPLAWPAYGQSSLGALNFGVLESSTPEMTAKPTASVAKVITALAVLSKHPLKTGEPGPTITLTAKDVEIYLDYVNKGGSNVPVTDGETISLYQALQAVLLPSSNNMADSLVKWAFGSEEAYKMYSNQYVKSLGMNHTTVAGASGFSAETVSTAHDLVLLGLEALKSPVISEIVNQKEAELPVAGKVRNVNWLLGQDGVNGIKTGNTEEAGGCYLVSATRQHATGENITVVAAIMGAPSLGRAINDSVPLLNTAFDNFVSTKIVSKDQKVGSYDVPWTDKSPALTKNDVVALTWRGKFDKPITELKKAKVPLPKGTTVGEVKVVVGGKHLSTPVILNSGIETPSLGWRISNFWR